MQFIAKLCEDCQGFAQRASVQRRTEDNNVTWFQFILDTEEDGRLVPKHRPLGCELKLTVCHIWQADSFIAMINTDGGNRWTIRLPRRLPKPPDKLFAMIVEIESVEQKRALLTSYHRLDCEELLTSATSAATVSAPVSGSPQFYSVINEFDIRQVILGQDSAVHIREVLSDLHVFRRDPALPAEQVEAAKNATDWLTKQPQLVIEYSDGGDVGVPI